MVEVLAFSGEHNSCGEANNGDGNNDKRGFHIPFNTAWTWRSCNQAGQADDILAGNGSISAIDSQPPPSITIPA
jgi:hypothetical protein